jgi:signal peptidase I
MREPPARTARLPVRCIAAVVISLAGAGIVLIAVRRRFTVVRVNGQSMLPTFKPGDRVLVRKVRAGALRRGQVVVFESPHGGKRNTGSPSGPGGSRWIIKRVAAVSGDHVPPDVAAVCAPAGACVPAGQFVAIGDGRSGIDSRRFGYVPAERVLGVAVRTMAATPAGTATRNFRVKRSFRAGQRRAGRGLSLLSRAAQAEPEGRAGPGCPASAGPQARQRRTG